ncbi:hypothetical protein HYW18_02890 [Candidatus Uhrbacteria bacterium]|nr:hypothetical protein [Candidatus Uhrbacteria bacterium]
MRAPKGLTLLEVVLYIAAFMIIVPAGVKVFLTITHAAEAYRSRATMEQTAALILSHLHTQLTEAPTLLATSSTFGNDNGVLVYQNPALETVTIRLASTTVTFGGSTHAINRLQIQIDAAPSVWVSANTINVTKFRFDPVYDSLAVLRGVNIYLEAFMLAPNATTRSASFDSQTAIALPPSLIVL